LFILAEISCVVNCLIETKRYIKFALAIETAESVEASAIQIVEKLRSFWRLLFTMFDQFIESTAVGVKDFFFVPHLNRDLQTTLNLPIEIYEMRIDIVQESQCGPQPESHGQSTTKRLNVAPVLLLFPDWLLVWNQPALATGPFQRRREQRLVTPLLRSGRIQSVGSLPRYRSSWIQL
jgi:hypothetical protein